MTLLAFLQLVVFTALLVSTVQLMPALGNCLRKRADSLQPGFHCAILAVRTARNLLGLVLATAGATPVPAIAELVPTGILLFVALAALNVLLSHQQQRSLESWSGNSGPMA